MTPVVFPPPDLVMLAPAPAGRRHSADKDKDEEDGVSVTSTVLVVVLTTVLIVVLSGPNIVYSARDSEAKTTVRMRRIAMTVLFFSTAAENAKLRLKPILPFSRANLSTSGFPDARWLRKKTPRWLIAI